MSVPRQDRFSSWASRHREAHALSQPLGRANLYWKLSLLWSIQLQIRQGWSQHRQFLRHGLRDPLEYGRTTWQHDMNVQNLTGCQRRTPLPMKFGKNHLSTKRKRSAPTGMMFLSGNSKFFFLLTTRLCRTNSCGCQRGHFGNSTLWRNTSKSSENGANVIKSPSRSQNQRNMTVLLRKCWCAALLRMSSQFHDAGKKVSRIRSPRYQCNVVGKTFQHNGVVWRQQRCCFRQERHRSCRLLRRRRKFGSSRTANVQWSERNKKRTRLSLPSVYFHVRTHHIRNKRSSFNSSGGLRLQSKLLTTLLSLPHRIENVDLARDGDW